MLNKQTRLPFKWRGPHYKEQKLYYQNACNNRNIIVFEFNVKKMLNFNRHIMC